MAHEASLRGMKRTVSRCTGTGWAGIWQAGAYSDYMDRRIFFQGAKKGEKFRITIVPYRFTGGVDARSHWCETEGFGILKGGRYPGEGDWVSKEVFCKRASGPRTWEIG